MKKHLIRLSLCLITLFLCVSSAYAKSDSFTPSWLNAAELTVDDWLESKETRALLTILTVADMDSAGKINPDSVDWANTYVGTAGSGNMLVIYIPLTTNQYLNVIYIPMMEIAAFGKPDGNLAKMEQQVKQNLNPYYHNDIDTLNEVVEIFENAMNHQNNRAELTEVIEALQNPGVVDKELTSDTISAIDDPFLMLDRQFSIGSIVTFGHYEQDNDVSNGKEDIAWEVLERDGNRVLLISQYGLDCQPYNISRSEVTWETCTLRQWLNTDFFMTAFDESERSAIVTTHVTADINPDYDTNPGNDTQDNVYLLSIPEVTKYFPRFGSRRCKPTAYAVAQGAAQDSLLDTCWWWLRTSGDYNKRAAIVQAKNLTALWYSNNDPVLSSGLYVNNQQDTVRPSLWLDLEVILSERIHLTMLEHDSQDYIVSPKKLQELEMKRAEIPLHLSIVDGVILRKNGTVTTVGRDEFSNSDMFDWTDIVSVSAGSSHAVGLKSDGTVVAVGENEYGECDVSEWTDIIAIAAGAHHTVGLKADGTVIAVGCKDDLRCNTFAWTDIVAITAGKTHIVGLKANGTVVAVGENEYGECNVSEWTDIIAITAGARAGHTVGLKIDGTVVAAGPNPFGQCNVSKWTDIAFIAAGSGVTVGIQTDGLVVATGWNEYGQCAVSDWTDIVRVVTDGYTTIGIKTDGTVVIAGWNYDGAYNAVDWANIKLPLSGN